MPEAAIKKPCADCSVTGPVSLTENLLNLFSYEYSGTVSMHRNRRDPQVSGGLRK